MITIEHLTDLLMKHLQGNLSQPEQEQLHHWVQQSDRNRRLFASVNDEEQLRQFVLLYASSETTDNEAIILSKIRQGMSAVQPLVPVRKMHGLWRWTSVAAITLVVAGIGYYIINNKGKSNTTTAVNTTAPADIQPGRDGAVLTLADGRQVVLDSLGNGVVASQNGARVTLKDGALAYGKEGSATPVYNTLTTPKGRQFQLILPDGSKVWLNAASSLRYPTVFVGNERRVAVSGEVYFEVAKNSQMPFKVTVPSRAGSAEIEVLGTQFNVNAYANETTIRTTLVEGSLKVAADAATVEDHAVVLKPGQQAQISNTTSNAPVKLLKDADVDKAVAWKRGIFNFEDASLEEVMRQIERWYDIQVEYEKNIPDIKFGGKMSNDVSLQGLLKSLQESDVHFRLEGRKLIVLP